MKVVEKTGVTGDFFTEGETISPGQALARVQKATDAKDFQIVALDADGNLVLFSAAVNYSFRSLTPAQVAASVAAAGWSDKITAIADGNGWTPSIAKSGGAVTPLDTDNANRKGATLIDQILEVKTRPAGFLAATLDNIYEINFLQTENSVMLDSMGGQAGTEFMRATASNAGRDFFE